MIIAERAPSEARKVPISLPVRTDKIKIHSTTQEEIKKKKVIIDQCIN